MTGNLRILASAGPMDKILKDAKGSLRTFPEIMYEFYSSDVRLFVASQLKEILDHPPKSFYIYAPDLQEKAQGVLVLELVAKLCESAEDLAAFGIAFATEYYMDALSPEEVWRRFAGYKTGEIVNFYRDIRKRAPAYFANLYGYPPIAMQEIENRATLLRSCRQFAAYLGSIAELYLTLRELHNSYKHGMRVFFGHLNDERTSKKALAISYIDSDAKVKMIPFSPETIEEIYRRCSGIGQILHGMLHWHKLRLTVAVSGNIATESPIFGRSGDSRRQMGALFFPSLFDTRTHLVSKANKIAKEKHSELSMLPRGDFIAIDVDSEEVLPHHGPELREVIWQAMEASPGARLVFRRITRDGKIGPY